jgi:hypothetical protein
MFKPFSLATGSTLTAKVKYNIELDWDYAYLVYSTDNGATWTGVQTNLSSTTNPYGQNYGYGITGVSSGWVDLTANLPAGNVLLGFRYWTDANTGGFGFMVDDIGPRVLWEQGCGISQIYKSVVCFGKAEFVEGEAEKKGILERMVRKYVPSSYPFPS